MRIYVGNSFDKRVPTELIDRYFRYKFIYFKEFKKVNYPHHLSMIDGGDITINKNRMPSVAFNYYNDGIKNFNNALKLQFEDKSDRDRNYYYAKLHLDKGVEVIPIIKYTHSASIIKQLLSLNLNYYAVSCTEKNKCYTEVKRFLQYLSDNFNIFHRRKIHLLGVSNKSVLNTFPLYSCNTNTLFTTILRFGYRYSLIGETNIHIDMEKRLKVYAKLEDYLNKRWEGYEYE